MNATPSLLHRVFEASARVLSVHQQGAVNLIRGEPQLRPEGSVRERHLENFDGNWFTIHALQTQTWPT